MKTSAPTQRSLCATSPTEPGQTLKVFLRPIDGHFWPHNRRRRDCFCGTECPARTVLCRRPPGGSLTCDRQGRQAGVLLSGEVAQESLGGR